MSPLLSSSSLTVINYLIRWWKSILFSSPSDLQFWVFLTLNVIIVVVVDLVISQCKWQENDWPRNRPIWNRCRIQINRTVKWVCVRTKIKYHLRFGLLFCANDKLVVSLFFSIKRSDNTPCHRESHTVINERGKNDRKRKRKNDRSKWL